MPTSDFTPTILDLKDAIINKVENSDDSIHFFFSLKKRPHVCPVCNAVTEQVHDYRINIIKDIPVMGKRSFLHYRKRRYRCTCCGKRFYESFPQQPRYCRTTTRLAFYVINQIRYTMNIKACALSSGVSPSYIFRRMRDIRYPKPINLPKVLSIDEFRGNANGQKFQAILTDAHNHDIIDILPSRSQSVLIDYIKGFKNRKDVRYFVMDMNKVYLDIAKAFLPNAKIVIDRFHIVRYITWAVENVRKRIQKQMHPTKRRYFKRSRRIILAHKNKLSDENIQALEVMLQQSNDLAAAYYLKELFYDFIDSSDRNEASMRLKKFITAAQVSDLDEFKSALTMLYNWTPYILNSFDCRYSNGYTEGMNNIIKVIKRNAYGYRNFDNFRKRINLTMKQP